MNISRKTNGQVALNSFRQEIFNSLQDHNSRFGDIGMDIWVFYSLHNRTITICGELLEHQIGRDQTETLFLLAVTIKMVLVPSLVKIVLPCGNTC